MMSFQIPQVHKFESCCRSPGRHPYQSERIANSGYYRPYRAIHSTRDSNASFHPVYTTLSKVVSHLVRFTCLLAGLLLYCFLTSAFTTFLILNYPVLADSLTWPSLCLRPCPCPCPYLCLSHCPSPNLVHTAPSHHVILRPQVPRTMVVRPSPYSQTPPNTAHWSYAALLQSVSFLHQQPDHPLRWRLRLA